MLTVGTKAPDFTLPDQNGIMHSLSEYSGKKVLLYFYPKDNTSGCSKQAASYSEKIAEFDKKNVTVVGISKDSVASHKKFESNYDLKFTLLSDTDRIVPVDVRNGSVGSTDLYNVDTNQRFSPAVLYFT